MSRFAGLLLGCLLGAFAPAVWAQGGPATPRAVADVDELVTLWSADQHLYVKGDLGVGAEQLSRLEAWLDEHGPHWTIALFEHARGETHTARDGRRYKDMDAVEVALGRGLALATDFSELTHAETGEPDGAVFILFLNERRFSYYASEAQDRRNLGESRWLGRLDQPAFRAMSGGGRILDAVRNTVTHVNKQLAAKIAAEKAHAIDQQRARERAIAHLRTDISATTETVGRVAAQATSLSDQFPAAQGPLARPPLSDWRAKLAELETGVTSDRPGTTKALRTLQQEIERYQNGYAVHANLAAELAQLEAATGALDDPAASEAQATAAAQLAAARQAHAGGELGLLAYVERVRAALEEGGLQIEAARRAEEQARAKEALIRQAVLGTLLAVAVLLFGLLVVLHRRRRAVKLAAEETLAKHEQEVKAELEAVYALFEHSRQILGAEERVVDRGYEGLTHDCVERAFDDVDDLFVMSAEVERVVGEARELVRPSGIFRKLAGLVRRSPFEAALRRLEGEAIEFETNQGLPLVMERATTGSEPLPERVSLTFPQVFAAFRQRTAKARTTLDLIESSLLTVDEDLDALEARFRDLTEREARLGRATDEDGLFPIPALFEVALPSAEQDLRESNDIAHEDPVRAVTQTMPTGRRKIESAMALADAIEHARGTVLPQLNDCAPALLDLDYETDWIAEAVGELGDQANHLFGEIAKNHVLEACRGFQSVVEALGQRATDTLALAQAVRDEESPRLTALEASIAAARTRIAETLQQPESQCLAEPGAIPDARLQTAQDHLAGVVAAIGRGHVDSARQSQSDLHDEVVLCQAIVDDSLQVLQTFEQAHQEEQDAWNTAQGQCEHHRTLCQQAAERFASSACLLSASGERMGADGATLDTHYEAAGKEIEQSESLRKTAAEQFPKAALLAAANTLGEAAGQREAALIRFREITDHVAALERQVEGNRHEQETIRERLESLATRVADRRTMRPTLQTHENLQAKLGALVLDLEPGRSRDPFANAKELATRAQEVTRLAAALDADHEAHAEARRALESLQGERSRAERLVLEARHDSIPDSRATTAAIREIADLASRVAEGGRELDTPHADWVALTDRLNALHSEIGTQAGRLRGELAEAQRLMTAFEAAARAVRDANRFQGDYGIRVLGSPGSGELNRARAALHQGNYASLAHLVLAAERAARGAVKRAEREIEQRRREERRQAEAARRARERAARQAAAAAAAASSMSSRTSSFRSSSSSFGSSSSGSSSSGGSPSGSGFSRSGW